MLHWLTEHYFFIIEAVAMLTGLVAIYYQIKENPVSWPVYIVNVTLYTYIYIESRLYAETTLMLYYFIVSIYGWYHWTKGIKKDEKLQIQRLNLRKWSLVVVIEIILFAVMAIFLQKFTNSNTPVLDALVTSLSFIATYLLAQKFIENWFVWFVADSIAIGLYVYKGLYMTVILFVVTTILIVPGYLRWRKSEDRI